MKSTGIQSIGSVELVITSGVGAAMEIGKRARRERQNALEKTIVQDRTWKSKVCEKIDNGDIWSGITPGKVASQPIL